MSMKQALVMGGTRFFGMPLVHKLLQNNYEVTIATRGKAEDPFGPIGKRIVFDRFDKQSMKDNLIGQDWDLVFDQLCYSSQDAQDACDIFDGRVAHYIMTSTLSVYEGSGAFKESQFTPENRTIRMGRKEDFEYGEGKQQAEAVFTQKANFPVGLMRIPIVMGPNDYTERLLFHIRRIKEQKPIYLRNAKAQTTFIHENDAGKFLAWVGEKKVVGPINGCSPEPMAIGDLMSEIGRITEKEVEIIETENHDEMSPYAIKEDWYLDNSKAEEMGYDFFPRGVWLPELISQLT